MPQTTLPTALFVSLLLCACGSTGGVATNSQAPVQPSGDATAEMSAAQGAPAPLAAVKPWAPAPWTGAFTGTAVMLADAVRIEGPTGLLEHVVASSDDAFYERSMETTPEGLLQVIRRTSPDVPEIRVQLDAWTIAAFDRVLILERIDQAPVKVIASGDALWRDSDGRIASANRIECSGEIGDETPSIPSGAVDAPVATPDDATSGPSEDAPVESLEKAGEDPQETVGVPGDSAGAVDSSASEAPGVGTPAGSPASKTVPAVGEPNL